MSFRKARRAYPESRNQKLEKRNRKRHKDVKMRSQIRAERAKSSRLSILRSPAKAGRRTGAKRLRRAKEDRGK